MSRGRHRKYPLIQTSTSTESTEVKVTMQSLYASPDGVARPGTVIDVNEAKAKELKDSRFARDYDRERDGKSPHGMQRYQESKEQ
jgi:hypothetical protein